MARPSVPALITTYPTVTSFIKAPLCSHTLISTATSHSCHVSASLWEQYRVSMWVGRPRGPGWFRSDGRRKLLQEIPNCQTHTIHNLSFYFSCEQNKARVKKLSRAPSVRASSAQNQNVCCRLRYGRLHAKPAVLHNPELGRRPAFLWHQLQLALTSQLN